MAAAQENARNSSAQAVSGKRVVALALGLVLATFLLSGGWLFASVRERRASLDAEEGRLMRSAAAVRSVVDESLDELRVREDHRPFYLYNHLYSPPDVLAISDPIAVSPLAEPPTDPRVVGHFQLDPSGRITTPYDDAEPNATRSDRAREVEAIVRGPEFDALRELAIVEPSSEPAPSEADPTNETDPGSPLLNLRLSPYNPASPGESLTSGLDNWGNLQAREIIAAQQGDPSANTRIIERGQQMPRISRRNVTWEEVETRQQSNRGSASQAQRPVPQPQVISQVATTTQAPPVLPTRTPSRAEVEAAMERASIDVLLCDLAEDVRVDVRFAGEDGRPRGVTVATEELTLRDCVVRAVRGAVRLDPFSAENLTVAYLYRAVRVAEPPLATAQPEAEVDYTDMVFRRVGDQLVLTRVVTHGGVSIVQGMLLDARYLSERWIPELAARHAGTEAPPAIVLPGEGRCAVRGPASQHLDAELCFPDSLVAGAVNDLDEQLRFQVGALLALLVTALLAALAIVRSARRAEALSRQKSAFVSAVSHELRTPLTTIRMHAEMLDEGLVSADRLPKVHRELVRESVRLARLVDNVLSLSLLEEGRRTLHRSDGDLRAHVREIVEGQRGFVEERGFTLIGPRDDAPVPASFDSQAIDQIVVNLMDNAVKYACGDDQCIEVCVVHVGGRPALTVSDRGPGIPPADRGRVFERFHRVEREDTAHAPGTGIGLALVSDLARAHGGEASVESREGGGCVVRITLSAS